MFRSGISRKDILFILIICLTLGLAAAYISSQFGTRLLHREETVEQQLAILRGDSYPFDGIAFYIPAFQNRVLFPAFLWLVSQLPILNITELYLLLRIATAFAAFVAYSYSGLKSTSLPPRIVMAGGFVLLFSLTFTFTHPWENPSDFLDLFFSFLFVFLVIKGQLKLLFLAALLAAFNRESSAFAGILWAVFHGFHQSWRPQMKPILVGAFMSASSYGLVIVLRFIFGGTNAIESTQMLTIGTELWQQIKLVLAAPGIFVWPTFLLLMFLPWLLWLGSNWGARNRDCLLLLTAAGVVTLLTLVFGRIEELRIFIPTLAILSITALLLEDQQVE